MGLILFLPFSQSKWKLSTNFHQATSPFSLWHHQDFFFWHTDILRVVRGRAAITMFQLSCFKFSWLLDFKVLLLCSKLVSFLLLQAPSAEKLPLLYLVDSIVKNVGGEYLAVFAKNLITSFICVFEKVQFSLLLLSIVWNLSTQFAYFTSLVCVACYLHVISCTLLLCTCYHKVVLLIKFSTSYAYKNLENSFCLHKL